MQALTDDEAREIALYPREVIKRALERCRPTLPLSGMFECLAHECKQLNASRLGISLHPHEDQDTLRQKLAELWCVNPINLFASILGQNWSIKKAPAKQKALVSNEDDDKAIDILRRYKPTSS